jgi:shikimate dehydrogenase
MITGATRILGLIADPVVQARSPAMVTATLERWGRFGDFVLVPFGTPADALADVIGGLRRIESFAGAIVSMPHKTALVPLVDELTPAAEAAGAVNVIRRTGDGRLVATLLDGEGFVAGLRATGREVAGAECLLVGAGGAASAIAIALAAHGVAGMTIVNRTRDKATVLADRVRAGFPRVRIAIDDVPDRHYDLAVNATSLGMRDGDALPMTDEQIDRATLVAECVVAPETTALLATARARGRATHAGVPMLHAQIELMLRFMGVAPRSS